MLLLLRLLLRLLRLLLRLRLRLRLLLLPLSARHAPATHSMRLTRGTLLPLYLALFVLLL